MPALSAWPPPIPDWCAGTGLAVARIHLPADACPRGIGGPTPVVVRASEVLDAAALAPTVAELLARDDLVAQARSASLRVIAPLADVLTESIYFRRRPDHPHFLAPIDLQVVKAAGVTFAASLIERVVEERAGGDPRRAEEVRSQLGAAIGGSLRDVVPGSEQAARLMEVLRQEGLWSQYLEVGLGTHPEIFTKAPVLASVGVGEQIGIRSDSTWNNPEPEIVLAVSPEGRIVGAAVGNDVNLRDFEGRSALLLGEAKDNNASCAIGPWIRLFDDSFTLESLMGEMVSCRVLGADGFATEGANDLAQISRHPVSLVRAATGDHHQYPDGFALFLGTMYVPSADRGDAGRGFTHHVGDRVEISCPSIGTLVNWVERCEQIPPWTSGIVALVRNLHRRGLLEEPH
jgi:fumarylacetoacetate (FAA) hydrolase family protein